MPVVGLAQIADQVLHLSGALLVAHTVEEVVVVGGGRDGNGSSDVSGAHRRRLLARRRWAFEGPRIGLEGRLPCPDRGRAAVQDSQLRFRRRRRRRQEIRGNRRRRRKGRSKGGSHGRDPRALHHGHVSEDRGVGASLEIAVEAVPEMLHRQPVALEEHVHLEGIREDENFFAAGALVIALACKRNRQSRWWKNTEKVSEKYLSESRRG